MDDQENEMFLGFIVPKGMVASEPVHYRSTGCGVTHSRCEHACIDCIGYKPNPYRKNNEALLKYIKTQSPTT